MNVKDSFAEIPRCVSVNIQLSRVSAVKIGSFMNGWRELARGILVDSLKVAASWFAEQSRAKALLEDSSCRSATAWLQSQVGECQTKVATCFEGCKRVFDPISFLCGFFFGFAFLLSIGCYLIWISKNRSVLRGEPLNLVVPVPSSKGGADGLDDGSSGEEVARARRRARALQG